VNEIHYDNEGNDEGLVDVRRHNNDERVLVEKHIPNSEFTPDLNKNKGI
jgi:hypothetical protein